MSGRRWGILALTAATVALSVGAAIAGHTVAGSAHIQPPPGPPAVGDCLIQAVPETGSLLSGDAMPGPTNTTPTPVPREIPAGAFAHCVASRFGEVVDVDSQPVEPMVLNTPNGISISDPTWTRCTDRSEAYLGLDSVATAIWRVDFGPRPTLVGPTERQRDAGQHWSACVLVTQASGVTPALAGSPRTLLKDGATRDETGQCQTNGSWAAGSSGPGACGQPHRSETFAYAEFSSAAVPSREQLTVSCLQLIRRTTGLPDSALGSLFAGVHVYDDGSLMDIGREPTADSVVLCGAVSTITADLTHSLIAWGDHPLPLA